MKFKYYLATILLAVSVLFSCNEDKWLKEEPKDFFSPGNSYVTAAQFDEAVARLYNLTRNYIIEIADQGNLIYHYTSDIAYDAIGLTHELTPLMDALIPESAKPQNFWTRYYRVIFDANVVISRIDGPDVEITSEAVKNAFKAEAMFFRAYMYRNLGIQFGGVPIVLEEISEPKRDFVRASQADVFKQAISDAVFAAANLPDVKDLKQDGRLTKAAANQLLTELYIIVKDYDKAIAAATSIINNSSYALMKDRFGVHKTWTGDVYWDLYRRGNQNRMGAGANKEAIWVSQYEYLVAGGGSGDLLSRFLVPYYWQLKGSDNKTLFFDHSQKYGGRGIGWMVATDYFFSLWSDPNDIRNSTNNIMYDVVADNPQSAFYGKKIVESGAINSNPNPFRRNWSAIIAKSSPINDFPPETIADPATGRTNNGSTQTFRDRYMMRLAETYLLRAEAYLGKNELQKAADDINVVRARAKATPVAPANVNIDYILDERARELHFEELRMLTLMRLGKWVDRVKLHDPWHNGKYASFAIDNRLNLWPIPQSEIERNTEAVLEQNPGYD